LEYEVKHTSYTEQQEFLEKTPAQQNLMIFMSSKETNGSVAHVIVDVAKLRVEVNNENVKIRESLKKHELRLVTVEHWQLRAAAVIVAAIAAGPGFFFVLGKIWT